MDSCHDVLPMICYIYMMARDNRNLWRCGIIRIAIQLSWYNTYRDAYCNTWSETTSTLIGPYCNDCFYHSQPSIELGNLSQQKRTRIAIVSFFQKGQSVSPRCHIIGLWKFAVGPISWSCHQTDCSFTYQQSTSTLNMLLARQFSYLLLGNSNIFTLYLNVCYSR